MLFTQRPPAVIWSDLSLAMVGDEIQATDSTDSGGEPALYSSRVMQLSNFLYNPITASKHII